VSCGCGEGNWGVSLAGVAVVKDCADRLAGGLSILSVWWMLPPSEASSGASISLLTVRFLLGGCVTGRPICSRAFSEFRDVLGGQFPLDLALCTPGAVTIRATLRSALASLLVQAPRVLLRPVH